MAISSVTDLQCFFAGFQHLLPVLAMDKKKSLKIGSDLMMLQRMTTTTYNHNSRLNSDRKLRTTSTQKQHYGRLLSRILNGSQKKLSPNQWSAHLINLGSIHP